MMLYKKFKDIISIFLLIFFIILSPKIFAQQWSDPINIGDGNTPDFVIDRNTGHLHIVYTLKPYGVYYSERDANGKKIKKELIPNTSTDGGEWDFGPTVAVDMDGYPHVCFREPLGNKYYSVFYTRKTASGWSKPKTITPNVKRSCVVRMAIDGNNIVHIARSEALTIRSKYVWGPITYYRIENGYITKIIGEFTPYRADNRLELDVTPDGTVHMILGCPGLDGDEPNYEGPITYFHFNDQTQSPTSTGVDIHSSQCWKRNGVPDVFIDTTNSVHMIYGAKVDQSVNDKPSIRYVLYRDNEEVRQGTVTNAGELLGWAGKAYGLGSVASSDDGEYVGVAYLNKDAGDLYFTMSSDSGTTWLSRKKLATFVGGMEGRNLHLLRANINNYYVVYPQNMRPNRVHLRVLKNVGDLKPSASSGGPYTGSEGQQVLFDASESFDPGQNRGIAEYAWDWENDGVYDTTTAFPIIDYAYTDDFNGQLKLQITDKIGQTDTDIVNVQIDNVPPVPDGGVNQTANEGDTLQLYCHVVDAQADTHSFLWNFGDGETAEGQQVEHAFRDNNSYEVVVEVTDDDGGEAADTVIVDINNLPPVAEAGGPYAGPILKTLYFQASTTDPGLGDTHSFAWDLNWDGIYETEGQEISRIYEEVGEYRIILQVTDDDGGVATDTADVTVTNYPPFIQTIPNQTIAEGEPFLPVDLDDFVIDEDQSVEELEWLYSGNGDLLVTLDSQTHLLTVAVPDSEWAGVETLHLSVRDPGDQMDETDVTFTVYAVNDPPFWSAIPDTTFYEDSTLCFPLNYFRDRVSDIDDAPLQFRFFIEGNTHLHWFVDSLNDQLCIYADPHWFGKERIQFIVKDKGEATDVDSSQITVYPVLDPPEPFAILQPDYFYDTVWPDSIVMIWQETTDPDPGDYFYYQWFLRMQGGSGAVLKTATIYEDTTYTFFPDENLEKGVYLWWVTAYDQNLYERKSSNSGILFIEDTSPVLDNPNETLPESYQLCQNYPNPFNPQTRLEYHLPESSHVRLAMYNTLGQEVSLLDEGNKNAGIHHVIWDGTNRWGQKLPSGIYFYRLVTGRHVFYRKMMLLQ